MVDRNALAALIEAVEKGDLSKLSGAGVKQAIGMHGFAYLHSIMHHGSLDAAKALHEALLPGWWVNYFDLDGFVQLRDSTDDLSNGRCADNPARAWLLAVLRALAEKGEVVASPAPVVPAEGPISTLEMVYRNMPDIPELPEAYQPRNIARSLAAPAPVVPAEGLDALAEAAISRAIARLQALPISAGRPAWDQIVADEMRTALRSAPPVVARVKPLAMSLDEMRADMLLQQIECLFGELKKLANPHRVRITVGSDVVPHNNHDVS